jgi:hypothetical protein
MAETSVGTKPAKWSLIGDLLDIESGRIGTELVVGDLELVAKWHDVPQTGLVEIDGGAVFSPPTELKAPGVMRRGTDYGVLVEESNYVRASKAFSKSSFPNGITRRAMRAFAIAVLLVSAACGRIHFDPHGGPSADGGVGDWWNPAWSYRKPLLVNPDKIDADLADFPVLVQLDSLDLGNALATGDDLRFVDAEGGELAFELEAFDLGLVPMTAWVKLPHVSATVVTPFYLYYGNPSAASAQQVASVWSGYAGVYHFGAGTLDLGDATGKNHGAASGITLDAGKILGAARFPGGPNIASSSTGVDSSPGGLNTVSFWMFFEPPYNKSLFAFLDANDDAYDLWMQSTGCFGFNTENSEVIGTTIGATTPLDGRWVHVSAVFYNGAPNTTDNVLWLDGVRQALTMCAGTTPLARTAGGTMHWASVHGYEFTGRLDEARVAPGGRTDSWARADYLNQVSPATFVTAGDQEIAP